MELNKEDRLMLLIYLKHHKHASYKILCDKNALPQDHGIYDFDRYMISGSSNILIINCEAGHYVIDIDEISHYDIKNLNRSYDQSRIEQFDIENHSFYIRSRIHNETDILFK